MTKVKQAKRAALQTKVLKAFRKITIIELLDGPGKTVTCMDLVTLDICQTHEQAIELMDEMWEAQQVYTVNGYGTSAQDHDFASC